MHSSIVSVKNLREVYFDPLDLKCLLLILSGSDEIMERDRIVVV